MKILAGVENPTSGSLVFEGRTHRGFVTLWMLERYGIRDNISRAGPISEI